MTPKGLAQAVKKFCRENADPERAVKYARYFTEGYDPYGIEQKPMEKARDQWLAAHREELGFAGFLEAAELLLVSGKYEEASFALWFGGAFPGEFTQETLDRFGQWLDRGFKNWAHTDVFCGEVLSVFLVQKIVPLKAFGSWRAASSKWRRRAVPVTLIKQIKNGAAVSSLVKFVEPMLDDPERVVQQGLGWFLREAWKSERELVEEYLLRHNDHAPRLVIQYATEKMTAAEKARFKKRSARSSAAGETKRPKSKA